MRNLEWSGARRRVVLWLAAMLVVGLSTATAVRAATVKFSLESFGGTFNLYAEEIDLDGFGIASYNVQLGGTLTNVDHNAPLAQFASKGPFNGPAGLSLLRSPDSAAPGNPFTIGASQDTVNAAAPANLIYGFGKTPGSFTGNGFNVLVAGTDQQTQAAKLKLATGTYTGAAPTLLSNVEVFANVFDTASTASTKAADVLLCDDNGDSGVCNGDLLFPPVVNPLLFNVVGTNPVTVSGTVTATHAPTTWGPPGPNLPLASFTPGFGAPSAMPQIIQAQWNPANQLFSWNTSGATSGTYTWNVTASNADGTGNGSITVKVFTPEPGGLVLAGLAVAGCAGLIRFRRQK